MSRALNLNAPQEHVLDMCAKHGAQITHIETLVSGGTRVVLSTGDYAAVIANAYKGKIIAGAIKRTPSRVIYGTPAVSIQPERKSASAQDRRESIFRK